MKFCRPVTSMMSSRVVRFSASALARHSLAVAIGSRCIRTLARPRAMVFSPTIGSTVGSGPSGSWSDRSRFQSCSRNLIAVCGDTCARRTSWAMSAASASVSPSTNVAAGQDEQVVGPASVRGEATLDVGVERLALLQRAVPGEDRVGGGGGELAAAVGVAGLEDHRAALRAARHVEPAADVEVRVGVGERARRPGRTGTCRCPCRRRSRRRARSRTACAVASRKLSARS